MIGDSLGADEEHTTYWVRVIRSAMGKDYTHPVAGGEIGLERLILSVQVSAEVVDATVENDGNVNELFPNGANDGGAR